MCRRSVSVARSPHTFSRILVVCGISMKHEAFPKEDMQLSTAYLILMTKELKTGKTKIID